MSTIYTTFVERESCFLKIWGQKEKNICLYLENALLHMKPQFDAGAGMLSVDQLSIGLLCCAKFNDDSYYRARVTNFSMQSQGMVEVLFIDYGNRDLIEISNIRAINNFPASVVSMPEQAKDFILAEVQLNTQYQESVFEIISNELRYLDFQFQYVGQVGPYSLLTLSSGGRNIAETFVARQLALPIEISLQLMMLQNLKINLSGLPIGVPQPQVQTILAQQSSPMQMQPAMEQRSPLMSPNGQPHFLTYKSLPQKPGTEQAVYVSYVTDGPCMFSIQLRNKEQELQELMIELNKLPLHPIEESILPGFVCLARSSEDNYICRAVVTSMADTQYKVFFVDFGNTEMRSFGDLFQIPFKYVIPKVMATRFALNGIHEIHVVSVDMKIAFKAFVNNQVLRMRVCAPFSNTGIFLCDLWNSEGVSALDYVRNASLQAYPDPVVLTRGFNQEVKVCNVFSCVKFHVQLRNMEEKLNTMMQELQTARMSPITSDLLKPNSPCVALYAADGMYYRAQILYVEGVIVTVKYVDYGNEEKIPVKDIKAPMMEFITNLRPQAIECCLNGYQNMANDVERDRLLEELLLEQYFTMKVADAQGSRTLVDLFDAELYNVASLLLDKVAKTQCKVSPALVQDNKIDHRKAVKPKFSPSRNNKTDLWRDKDRCDRSPRNLNNDWRQARGNSQSQNSFDNEDNEFRKNTSNDRNNRGDRNNGPPRENSWDKFENSRIPKTKDWGGGDNRLDANFNENKRPNDLGGVDRREPRDKRNNYSAKNDNCSEHNWNGNKKPELEFNKRPQRDGSNSSPRRRGNRSDDNVSEKSFGSGRSFKGKRDNLGGSQYKRNFEESVEYAEPTEQFAVLNVVGTQHKASVSWFYNPANFYLQHVDENAKFSAMMKDIQFAYMKRKSSESAEIGNTVIAQFPEDRGLYRALVLEKLLTGNYKVLYVDFGNMAVTGRIHKVEKRFMALPVQAVQCGLAHVHPVGEQWPKADAFAKFFGVDIMDCQFGNFVNKICEVEITSKGKNLKDELHNAGLIKVKNPYEHFDITYLFSQQMYCALDSVRALDDITLQILPGLSVSCALFKFNQATTPDLERLKSYIGHMVVVYVDEVLDSKIYITLYNTRGQYIPAIELQEGMFKAINPISAALIIGPHLAGYVAHATSKSVFIQTEHSAKQLEFLLDQLFAVYETSEPGNFEVQEIIYAVRSTDGNWYRGLVESVEGDNITVTFVDYGNQEEVQKSALRILNEDFFMPFCACEIKLEGGEAYLEQEIELKIVYADDSWTGEIIKKEAPLNEPTSIVKITTEQVQLIEGTSVIPPTISAEELQQPQPQESPLSPIGFSVQLSHFDNPGQFYLQLSSALDAIAQLQGDLQPQVESLADIENITTGILCAAPYSANQVWYRAQVLDADSDITTVRFIDYGNTDVLGNDIKIKTLPTELLSLEEHAKRCSLNLSPVNGEWASDACKKFEKMTNEGSLTAEIVHQDEKTTFVRLYVKDECINDIFTSEGFATELQVPQAAFRGFVSNLNSPSEFWLQYEHACNDLEWIADQLVNADKFNQLDDQAPGSLCAAIFPEDDSWYRARILSNTVAGVEVLFIDYGNSCTCTSLRELPEDLVMVPALAHKCSLLKPQGLLEWSPNATEKFKEVSADGVTVFTVIKHAQGETNQVQLLLHEEDVSEILKSELFEAKLLSAKSLAEFALRKSDDEAKFVDLQSKIQELVDKPDADEIVVAAQYENVFYRAKINGSIVNKYVVDLIDLGIEADVSKLRQLPKELAVIEPLAISAKMNPVTGYTFNSDSETYFKNLCRKDKIFHVELVTDKIVKLYVDRCDIRENMPATKCILMNSVHSTPKKVKTDDVLPEENVSDIRLRKHVEASPILLNDAGSDLEHDDVHKKTTEAECILEEVMKEDEHLETELSESKNQENLKSALAAGIEGTEEDRETMTTKMITDVTDELVDKVVKHCNLSVSDSSEKDDPDTIVNGKHDQIDEIIG